MATLARALVVGICFSVGVLHAAPVAAQESPTETEARSVFAAGQVAFSDGRYADALGYFQRAHALSSRPALLFNIALCQDRLRDDDAAIEAYDRYLVEVPLAPNRGEVEDRLGALRGARARRLAAAQAVQPTNVAQVASAVPGPPVASASEPSAARPASEAPAANVPHDGPAIYETWWFWTIIGVVVLGGAVGAGVALSGDQPLQPGDIGGVLFALGGGQ